MATTTPILVSSVQVIPPYGLSVTFSDGTSRRVDLAALLEAVGGPDFGPLRDPAYFAQVYIDGFTVA